MDPYSILNLPQGSGTDAVKKAYTRLVRTAHPDLNPGIDPARFHQIQAAYEHLVFGKPFTVIITHVPTANTAPRRPQPRPRSNPYDAASRYARMRTQAARRRDDRINIALRQRMDSLKIQQDAEKTVRDEYYEFTQFVCDEYAARSAYIDTCVTYLRANYATLNNPYRMSVLASRIRMSDDKKAFLTSSRNTALDQAADYRTEELGKIAKARAHIDALYEREVDAAHREYDEALRRF